LLERVAGLVDLIVCNPPYVETDEDEQGTSDLRAAWAGGPMGLSFTNRLVELIPKMLSSNGVAYVVFEDQNKPYAFMEESRFHLKSEVILKRRAGRELLYVLKFQK